jgi:hypothetical protein
MCLAAQPANQQIRGRPLSLTPRPASDKKQHLNEAVNAAMIIVTLNWGALPVEQYLLVSRTSFSRKTFQRRR